MSIPMAHTVKGYELLELIGEGAYGAVYRAYQPQVKREVAVKIILTQYANQPDFIRRFESEAQLVAQLEHLHIVPLYDYWRDPQGAYLVMRLMKGGSLGDSMQEGGPWNQEETARLVDQIASALEAAHQQGVVHRDLKPANILLDEEGNAYLSDFGIAKELEAGAEVTQTGAILGTPAYITPEQVQSQPISPQTDIYALGVLLYELLVGEHPFPDSSTAELVTKHLHDPLPYVRDTHPELPAAVDGVIQRATAKDPTERYPDALALAEDYRRALQLEAALPEVPEEKLYNPYKGLRAFQEADADDFFGREALTGQLLAHLADPGVEGRFLAVVGPSGSGKSSVVKAGLVPALRKGALPGSDQWYIVEMHPGMHPLGELQLALLSISADPEANLGELLRQDENGIMKAARAILPGEDSELLVVIDQFEELFILVEDEEERNFFLESLHTVVSNAEGQVRVVITLRADFYDRPLMHPEFGKLVEERTAVVLPLTPEELELAIQRPAERVGVVLERGLVPTITTDLADQPGALPLLQYALTELFERREGRMLTNEAYEAIGGVLGALGRRAEEVFTELDDESGVAARQLYLRLVTLGEGAEDTRRRVLRPELESLFSEQLGLIDTVIDVFGKARLLSFDRDPITRGPTVEVAHEALLHEWRRLSEWLDESRADIRMQRVLGNAAQEWQETDRDPGYLLRDTRLDQFEAWAATTDMALTQVEGEYLDASLEERRVREAAETERQAREAAMERRSRNFLRALVGVLAVATIVAVVLSIFAFNQRGEAQNSAATAQAEALARGTQQGIAETEADRSATQEAIAQAEAESRATQQAVAEAEANARATAESVAIDQRQQARIQASIGLASQSELELGGPAPERAVLLALEALDNYPYTWQAERALGQAIINNRLRLVVPNDDEFQTADWTSDGTRILISGAERVGMGNYDWENATARVLDAFTGDELMRITEGEPNMASWSPDESSILALNDKDAIVKIWDVESGTARLTLDMDDLEERLNTNPVGWQPWSPSGDRFLIYNVDGLVKIFDAHTGEVLQTLSGHLDPLPDEEIIEGNRRLSAAMWSPRGDLIVVSSVGDSSIIVYQSDSGEALYTIPGGFESDVVVLGSWSPSGDRFVTRGMGGAKVYEAATGQQLFNLSVPQTYCAQALWSPDGSRILTADGWESATVWDAESGQVLIRIEDIVQVLYVDWSPSGKFAAMAGADGFVHVWDVINDMEFAKLSGTMGWAYPIAYSPEGERIFAMGDDNKMNIFDLTEASMSIPIPSCGNITNAAWSPDGEQIAIGAPCPPDYPVNVWDASSSEQLFELIGDQSIPDLVAWSPSGDRILTVYTGSTAMVWDASSGELLLTFTGHESEVRSGTWSPDGGQVATGDVSGNVIVWDPSSGEEILTFAGHKQGSTVQSARWSPDGSRVMTTSDWGEAIIWDAATGQVLMGLFLEDYKIAVSDAAWIEDGERVIVLSADGYVRIFDSRTGKKFSQFKTPSGSSITAFTLSPTEERMIIGGHDGVATVWEIATGAELFSYEVGGFVWPTYSPDGTRVLIGNTEGDWGKVQIFPTWHSLEELIAYAKECCVVRELTPEEREVFGLSPQE